MLFRNHRTVAVLAAAVLGISATLASAQMKVGEDGRAGDANTRVGSGGYNTPRPNLQLASPNDIALGNVNGGKEFRGSITRDPTQPFGGRSNLPSDRFARSAVPVLVQSAPVISPGAVTQFYSSAPTVNAPRGFVLNPYTGQYVNQTPLNSGTEDIDFGVPPGTPVMRPGANGSSQLVLPTILRDENGAAAPTVLTATPLLGLRVLPGLSDEDRFLLSRSTDARNPDAADVSPAQLRKLREELKQTLMTDPQLGQRFREAEVRAQTADEARQSPLTKGADLSGKPLDASLTRDPSAPQLDDRFGPGSRNPILMELQKAEAARREAGKTAKPKPNTDGILPPPAGDKTPVIPSTQSALPKSATPEANSGRAMPMGTDIPLAKGPASLGYVPPIHVGALSESQPSAGIKQILAGAEKLVADGRYASAADRYQAAGRFAPGDATIISARAQAELGAGFFARAEASLREAVNTDPSVLGAQYDFRKSIGDKRVDQLVSDLKRISLEDKTSALPIMLLAYIAYNTGDDARAVSLLEEASIRQPNDALVAAMKARWSK